MASLNLRMITFYGGLGYSNTNTKINMTGNFPMPTSNTEHYLIKYVYEDAGVLNDFPKLR